MRWCVFMISRAVITGTPQYTRRRIAGGEKEKEGKERATCGLNSPNTRCVDLRPTTFDLRTGGWRCVCSYREVKQQLTNKDLNHSSNPWRSCCRVSLSSRCEAGLSINSPSVFAPSERGIPLNVYVVRLLQVFWYCSNAQPDSCWQI